MSRLSDRTAQLDVLPADEPHRRPTMPDSSIACGAILILGIVISFAGFRGAQTFYLSEARIQFELFATQRSAVLSQTISRYSDSVGAINKLFAAGSDVTRAEFATFVVPMLRQFPAIRALEWIPKVRSGERADFEKEARRDGLTDFRISQIGTGKNMARAGFRTEHFPVYFVEPFDRNKRSVGFDLASDPTLLAALNEARDSGRAVATHRLRLFQEKSTQPEFLLFVPIYRNGIAINTVAQRRAALRGYGLGVFSIRDMIANTLKSAAQVTGLDTYVFDDNAPASRRLLAFVPSLLNTGNSPPLTEQALRDTHAFTTSHDISGQTWRIVFSPVPGYFSGKSNVPFGILSVGLLISVGIAFAVSSCYKRVRTAKRLIAQRSVELREMTQELTQSHAALNKSRIETHEAKQRLLDSLIETHEAKQRLLDALKVSPSGLVLFDKNDRLILFNSMAEQMNLNLGRKLTPGMEYSEYERLNLENHFPDASSDEIDEKLAETIQNHRDSFFQ